MTTEHRSPITLCVLLWARPGQEVDLGRTEEVLLRDVLGDHGGSLLARATSVATEGSTPTEVHLIRFPTRAALDDYLADGRRRSLASSIESLLVRSRVFEVTLHRSDDVPRSDG
jgi:hypothetical protein